MAIDWTAVDQSQDDDFAAQLAQQEVQQSLVFKLLAQREREQALARDLEDRRYRQEQDTLQRDFNERQFKAAQENTAADNKRQDLATTEAAEYRAWQQFQAELGVLPSGSEVSPALFEKAKRYHVEGRFEPTGRGTYRVLPSAKEIADAKRDADRDETARRLARASEANLVAQTHRLQNEDRRIADQQKRTDLLKQRTDKLNAQTEKLSPEQRAMMMKFFDAKVKAASGYFGGKPSEEDLAQFAEAALNEARGLGRAQAPAGRGTAPTTSPPAKSKYTVLDVK